MRFANKEDRHGTTGGTLPALRASLDRTSGAVSLLLVWLLIFSSPVMAAVAASSSLRARHARPDSPPQAAVNPRQGGDLPRPYDVFRKGLDNNNYLASLLELKAHETQYLASDSTREAYLEYIIQLYADVGDYPEAYSYEDKLLQTFPGLERIRALYAKDLTTSPIDNY